MIKPMTMLCKLHYRAVTLHHQLQVADGRATVNFHQLDLHRRTTGSLNKWPVVSNTAFGWYPESAPNAHGAVYWLVDLSAPHPYDWFQSFRHWALHSLTSPSPLQGLPLFFLRGVFIAHPANKGRTTVQSSA